MYRNLIVTYENSALSTPHTLRNGVSLAIGIFDPFVPDTVAIPFRDDASVWNQGSSVDEATASHFAAAEGLSGRAPSELLLPAALAENDAGTAASPTDVPLHELAAVTGWQSDDLVALLRAAQPRHDPLYELPASAHLTLAHTPLDG